MRYAMQGAYPKRCAVMRLFPLRDPGPPRGRWVRVFTSAMSFTRESGEKVRAAGLAIGEITANAIRGEGIEPAVTGNGTSRLRLWLSRHTRKKKDN